MRILLAFQSIFQANLYACNLFEFIGPFAAGFAAQQAHAITLGEVAAGLCPEVATPLAENTILGQAITVLSDVEIGEFSW